MEGAGSDDAVGATGAVENDGGVRPVFVQDVRNVEGQLPVGHAATAGDCEVQIDSFETHLAERVSDDTFGA